MPVKPSADLLDGRPRTIGAQIRELKRTRYKNPRVDARAERHRPNKANGRKAGTKSVLDDGFWEQYW